MAAALEWPRWSSARIDIAQADFDRLWSLTSVIFLGAVFYLALGRQGLDLFGTFTGTPAATAALRGGEPDWNRVSGTALTILRWLPYLLFPFTLAVVWSRTHWLPWSTFSLYQQALIRRAPQRPVPEWARRHLHAPTIYLGLTLFAATTNPAVAPWFLPTLLVVGLIALWPRRNRRYGVIAWAAVLIILGTAAWLARDGHTATRKAWEALEDRLLRTGASSPVIGGSHDQQRRSISFGTIAAAKPSAAIVLRVTGPTTAPGLLRDAAFNRYDRSRWDAPKRDFQVVDPLPPPVAASLTIARASLDGDTALALPLDAASIALPPPAIIERGALGAWRVRGGLPQVIAGIGRGPLIDRDPPVDDDDRAVTITDPADRATITAIADRLGLAGQPPAAAIDTLNAWFAGSFTYALAVSGDPATTSPLTTFLDRTRTGHCEAFATAGALILRAAGIPTRYTVGYSVTEQQDDTWIARGRHAHAWVMAWYDDAWHDVDPTPPDWHTIEAQRRSWWESASDAWSNTWFAWDTWRQSGGRWQLLVFLLGSVILAWIGWRQIRGSAWRRARTARTADHLTRLGLDSPFFAVLTDLERTHGQRPAHETPRAWLNRLHLTDHHRAALDRHEAHRFDPAARP
jgi:transglutaminase-like putative cysteine protease